MMTSPFGLLCETNRSISCNRIYHRCLVCVVTPMERARSSTSQTAFPQNRLADCVLVLDFLELPSGTARGKRNSFPVGASERERDLQITMDSLERRMSGKIASLDDLIAELHRTFEKDTVNVEHVQEVMESYKSNPREWRKFAKFDRHRYTRNLVDEGNGKFNLMVLAWSEGQGSSIHDHSNSHCFMKVLQGNLCEVRYPWPSESEPEKHLEPLDETTIEANEVAYINDSLGLHRVENRSHTDTAVSLHLYVPPFDHCHMFDQRTGHKSRSTVTFWSKHGNRTPLIFDGSKPVVMECEDN